MKTRHSSRFVPTIFACIFLHVTFFFPIWQESLSMIICSIWFDSFIFLHVNLNWLTEARKHRNMMKRDGWITYKNCKMLVNLSQSEFFFNLVSTLTMNLPRKLLHIFRRPFPHTVAMRFAQKTYDSETQNVFRCPRVACGLDQSLLVFES